MKILRNLIFLNNVPFDSLGPIVIQPSLTYFNEEDTDRFLSICKDEFGNNFSKFMYFLKNLKCIQYTSGNTFS